LKREAVKLEWLPGQAGFGTWATSSEAYFNLNETRDRLTGILSRFEVEYRELSQFTSEAFKVTTRPLNP
jgi:hypothetical protein